PPFDEIFVRAMSPNARPDRPHFRMSSRTVHLDDVRCAAVLAAALFIGAALAHAFAADVDPAPIALPRHLVDVNAAPAGEIQAMPGVGRVLAERIVSERAKGSFADVDDLRRVPGVGPTTSARLRSFARCGLPSTR